MSRCIMNAKAVHSQILIYHSWLILVEAVHTVAQNTHALTQRAETRVIGKKVGNGEE